MLLFSPDFPCVITCSLAFFIYIVYYIKVEKYFCQIFSFEPYTGSKCRL
ncbi:hypothetical protein CLOSTHATH_03821 [Hungatella hathewayi DSM 13479]|uniref:Uncharacterized protein n=1 Tax=Hungatella hathewayi DSM 13479 TaxID=566550 RepID=D3AJN1_9FIRM|nr:hypothetical protein CLOSTHATH_03821 [Hungatella hathewayi DSM 13479]